MAAWLARDTLLALACEAGLRLATGYSLHLGKAHFGSAQTVLSDVRVRYRADPVFEARRVELDYVLRDLLPGGRRRFGLAGIAIDGPSLHLIRHKDGSFNLAPSGGNNAPSGRGGAPFAFDARVAGGSVELVDPLNLDPRARDVRMERIQAEAHVQSDARTTYRVEGAILQGDRPYPIRARATIDVARGYALHRFTAPDIPVPAIANYFIDSPEAVVQTGDVRDFDVRLYALGVRAGAPLDYHLGGSARVDGVGVKLDVLTRPVRQLRGTMLFADNAVVLPKIEGAIGTTPLLGTGGIYDFSDPKFRLAVRTIEDLRVLHRDFDFLKTEPLSGLMEATTLMQGEVGNPLIFASARAARVAYGTIPIRDFRATVGYYDGVVVAGDVAGSVGGIAGRVAGRFLTGGKDVDGMLALDAHSPPGTMPYLDRFAPRAPAHFTVTANGLGLLLDSHGVFAAAGGGQRAEGTFSLNPRGVGEFGPFTVEQGGGARLTGAMFMQRERGTSGLWADAAGIRIFPPDPRAVLPGVPLPPFPPIAGLIDARAIGIDLDERLILAGEGRARDAEIAGTRIDDARGDFAGPTELMALSGIDAHGAFGHFAGRGAFGSTGFAFSGNLDGTLEGMRQWTGDLGARGKIAGPVAIVSMGDRTLVQTPGVRLERANVRGVPLNRLAGTMAVSGDALTVYAADAQIGGGRAVARGDSARGIVVASGNLAAAQMRGTGLPLAAGTIVANGALRMRHGQPSFDGGVALVGGRFERQRIDASADLSYGGDAISLRNAVGSVAEQTFGFVDGTIAHLSSTPRYDLTARVRSGDLSALARTFALPVPHLTGSLDADFQIGGSGRAPAIAGTMRMPEGSVNGLSFSDAQADVSADPRGVAATNGQVTVGSTQASFNALARGRELGFALDASHADLADFNDFFDPSDTLAGTGSVHARFARHEGTLTTGGSFDVEDLRVRRLPFGHTVASWNSAPGSIAGSVAVAGPSGSLRASGNVQIPHNVALHAIATRANLDLTGSLQGVDLDTWLPLLGYTAPVLGHIDATGSIRGSYPNLAVDVDGDLLGGVVGKLPIDRLHVAVGAGANRLQVRSLQLDVADMSISGSGSFGFASGAPLSLNLKAHSDRLGTFVDRVLNGGSGVDGRLDAHVDLGGTLQEPQVTAGFDATSLRLDRLVIPRVVASADLQRGNLSIRDATVTLATGSVNVAGAIPIRVSPFGPVPPGTPLGFDVDLHGVGLDQFAGLMPVGTKLGGVLDGLFGVRGTVDAPLASGQIHLSGGSYSGPVETEPIAGLRADLSLDGTSVRLTGLQAAVGGGNLRGEGSLMLPTLALGPGALTTPSYDVEATFDGVRLAFAGYGASRVDGTAWLRRQDGAQYATLGGGITVSDASIPLGAFLKSSPASAGPEFSLAAALPSTGAAASPVEAGVFHLPAWVGSLGLDLGVTAANNVRIRSAILDVGGKGSLKLAGRIANPSLDGRFEATPGGTLFLNRPFKVQEARVLFTPSNGIAPNLFARATTQVGNPATDVTITAQGTIPDIRLSYASSPPYDEATIVGLLFGAYGGNLPPAGLNAFAPTTNILLPPNAFQQTNSGTFQLSSEAANLINAQFTARLLAPIEQGLGTVFGLSDLSLNLGPSRGFGIQARRLVGRNVSVLYGSSLSYPYRITFGVESRPNPQTSLLFTGFTQQGVYQLGGVKPDAYLSSNPYLGSAADLGGTQGFTVNYQRLFR